MNNFISELGFKSTTKILNNLITSKYLTYNVYTNPNLQTIKLIFPLFENIELNKSRSLLIILDYIFQLTHVKPRVSNIKILIKKGVFYKCEVYLNKWQKNQFLFILNEIFLSFIASQVDLNPIKINAINNNLISMQMHNIDFMFDTHVRRKLPINRYFWLQIEFFFKKSENIYDTTQFIYFLQKYIYSFIFHRKLNERKNN